MLFNLPKPEPTPVELITEEPKEIFKLPLHFVNSKQSVEKLNELKFNPIVKMVELYDFIERELEKMVFSTNADGTPKKYSQLAFTSLLATQQKISNDLMRYGYARVTEAVDVNTNHVNVAPLQITLTGTDNFSTEMFNPVETQNE